MDKEKYNMQKFIKEEIPNGRLKSLKLPRDLNLGGIKQVKKSFVPNLNVVRNKDKTKEVIRKTEQKRKERVRQNKRNGPGERYVQSTGIFSEGTAGEPKRSYCSSEKWASSKENDSSSMTIPTFKRNSSEKENEESILDEILKQDEDSEDEKLPFKPITWNENVFKDNKVYVKQEISNDIKKEEAVIESTFKSLKLEQTLFSTLPKQYMYQESYNNHDPNLSIWRLPDSFAGKGLSEDPNCKKLFDYCLNDMTEGQIGKLIIRQSGHVEVYIGRIKYELLSTEFQSCMEELVALEVKENYEATAAVIGQIQDRLILNPNWESLTI
ncbi:hypothetical protein NQ317_017501 [Molorchus minor]|uniref:DNA-directed RNA polymerase III subunit RPC4 n=1 Tax=Molorchus minor TaxID=1323400 RepID=A0ABQ9JNQ6_9CUCU|nr:hypothetical protein NQ317_017501 [Molorchus minor]